MEDLGKKLEPGPRQSRPIVMGAPDNTRASAEQQSIQNRRNAKRVEKYKTVDAPQPEDAADDLVDMPEIDPTEIYNIFSKRAERTNQAAVLARKRIHEHERKLLPEEMFDKIDQNKYDIETQKAAIDGHKTTIGDALHIFNGKDWEDLRQIGETFIDAMRKHDAYTANTYGYNFVMGVFATQPAYLTIIDIYEDMLGKAVENYDLALQLLADNMEELTKARAEIEPKRLVNKQAHYIKRLELKLLRVNAGLPPEEDEDDVGGDEGGEKPADNVVPPVEEEAVSEPGAVKPPGETYGRTPKRGKKNAKT
jgi:hypothetical protein